MKRILVNTMMMFVALATLTLTSCQKSNEELILGKWDTQVATLTSVSEGAEPEVTDLSPIFKGFEFVEGGTGSAYVNLGEEVSQLACTWTIEEDALTVVITDMAMTMPLTIKEISKTNLVIESVSEIYGTTMTMHFEMNKAE